MAENEVPEIPDDRRSGIDKRQAEPWGVDPEHRSGEERRQFPGRRGHYYGFKYSTQDKVEELRKWLEETAKGTGPSASPISKRWKNGAAIGSGSKTPTTWRNWRRCWASTGRTG